MNLLTPLRRAVTIGGERPAVVGDWGTLVAGYKVPKRWDTRDGSAPLPKSGAGKILERELRAPHWEGGGRTIGGGA